MRISDWSSDVCSSDLFDIVPAALQARIGEVGGRFVDARKFVAVGEDDGHIPLAGEVDEGRVAEAFVPDLDRMAQRQAVLRFGEEVEKGCEIVAVELFRRHEQIGRASCRERVCQYV